MTPEHRHPRRRDRSKGEAWIRALLHRGEAAVLAAVREGLPFSLPRIYAYDQERDALYVHGAHGGEMGKVMNEGGAVGGVPMVLTVFEMGRLLPADEALEFGVEYASVVVMGKAVEVEDPEEAEDGLQLFDALFGHQLADIRLPVVTGVAPDDRLHRCVRFDKR